MTRGGRLVPALILALLACAVLAAGAGAQARSADAKGGKIIVAPKGGQVFEANVAKVSIRTGRGMRIRLNGAWIPGRELGRARHGVRSLRVSLSYGLRPGRNTLTVKLRRHGHRRRATVNFFVKPPDPLLGAGRDQVASTGEDVRLAGRIEPGAPREAIGWTPIRVPAEDTPSCEQAGPPTRLRSPAGLRAGFTPRLPGEYVYKLSHGSGPGRPTDVMGVKVTYPNHMVPVETMATNAKGEPGIKVGRATYLLKDATAAPGAKQSHLQVLELKRGTLECEANSRYKSVSELEADLNKMTDEDLVVVSMQPGAGAGTVDGNALYSALARIGFPAEDGKTLPTTGGPLSGIGVPGMARGDADVNVVADGSENADMVGYFVPDQWRKYTYMPKLSEPFRYEPEPIEPCKDKNSCEAHIGYLLRVQNPRTGKPVSEATFATGGPSARAETERLVGAIEAVPAGDLVRLVSLSDRTASETTFPPSLGPIDQGLYDRLVTAVTSIGGTRNGFNRTAFTSGPGNGDGRTYVLVGWKGAAAGEGAEAAAGVFGQGAVPQLTGVLRPNRRSLLRPTLEGEVATGLNLPAVLQWEPVEKWPLEGNPGAMKAFAYLGEQFPHQLGAEPRTSYWELELDPSKWRELANEVGKVEWSAPPKAKGFGKAEFLEARKELSTELRWVANVHEYLTHLSEPFSQTAFSGWAQAVEIGNRIYAEANAHDEESSLEWIEFTTILLKLAGPLTGHISATVGELMDLEVWAYGATATGAPTYDQINIKSTELASQLRKEMESAVRSYGAMIDVIVSDPKKLEEVGTEGNCKPGTEGCDEFSWTGEDQLQASAALSRAVERLAYEKLLPTSYYTYKLNRDPRPEEIGGKPRNAADYACGEFHPWGDYPVEYRKWAYANLLESLDVSGGKHNGWQNLVIGQIPKFGWEHDEMPPEAIMKRMFEPVPGAPEKEKDGLGMSAEEFLANQRPDWQFWDEDKGRTPPGDSCYWAPPR